MSRLVIGDNGGPGQLLGVPMRPPSEVAAEDFDCVIVASFRPAAKPIGALTERGIPSQKIVALRGR